MPIPVELLADVRHGPGAASGVLTVMRNQLGARQCQLLDLNGSADHIDRVPCWSWTGMRTGASPPMVTTPITPGHTSLAAAPGGGGRQWGMGVRQDDDMTADKGSLEFKAGHVVARERRQFNGLTLVAQAHATGVADLDGQRRLAVDAHQFHPLPSADKTPLAPVASRTSTHETIRGLPTGASL